MSDILLDISQTGVAIVTLNRPEKRNVIRHATWLRLRELCGELESNDAARVVILTGQGRHFCAGADISEFATVRSDEEAAARFDADIDAAEEALAGLSKPSIAAISGYCLGGGCSLALCCDIRIADHSARFAIPAARLGVVYGLRDSQALVNAVGLANAKRIMFTADQFTAAEAHAMGLVDVLVDADPQAAARGLASRIAENAPLSLAGSKFVLHAIASGDAGTKSEAIRSLQRAAHTSKDHHEAARAFMEKRKPVFQGR